jgi:hypothetical protein
MAAPLLDAVPPVAEIDVVQIELEDLVLRELLLDPPGEQALADLALVRALRAEQQVLDDLLGDGAAALARLRRPQVHLERAEHAEVVEAVVLVKARVLGGEHGELHLAGDGGDADQRPALEEDLAEQRAVAREHPRHLRRIVVPELLRRGEAGLEMADREGDPDQRQAEEHRQDDRDPLRPDRDAAPSARARGSIDGLRIGVGLSVSAELLVGAGLRIGDGPVVWARGELRAGARGAFAVIGIMER